MKKLYSHYPETTIVNSFVNINTSSLKILIKKIKKGKSLLSALPHSPLTLPTENYLTILYASISLRILRIIYYVCIHNKTVHV